MYNTLFGSIGVMLRHGHEFSSSSHDKQTVNDESSEGWRRIRQVATLRKLARKLRQKCRQIDQDIEVRWVVACIISNTYNSSITYIAIRSRRL
jgi:hypothetical protein